jgi:hypothetical protein
MAPAEAKRQTRRRRFEMRSTLWLTAALIVAAPLSAAALTDGNGTPPQNPPAGTPPAGTPPGGTPPAGTPPADGQQAKDQAAAQYLKDLKTQLSKIADADAKAAIKKLVEIWKDKDVTDDTKKPVPDLLEHFGKDDKTLVAIDGIAALGDIGAAEGAAPVLRILDRALKAKDPSVDVYGGCLSALKRLADTKPATVKTLSDLLKNKSDDVVSKSADAIAGYKDAPGKVRRDLLEELIKATEGTSAQAKDPKNSGQVRKWNIIQTNVMAGLKALSGQQFKDVAEARQWFNQHKKDKSWDT